MNDDSIAANNLPWASFDQDGETEDWLEGNRSGLLVLRHAIDQALARGECRIEKGHVELMGVRQREQPYSHDKTRLSLSSKLAISGCIVLLVAAVITSIIGLAQIIQFLAGLRS